MSPTVLIVDPSADNREVLRTALARRGLTIFEAEAADRGLELAREHRPDVIVNLVGAARSVDPPHQSLLVVVVD